jgi:hypothetical protein
MPKKLTRDEMRELVARHRALEAENDWDGALATMADEPFYELFPYRLRVVGPLAIRSMWRRFFGSADAPGAFASATVDPDTYLLSEYVKDDSVVHFTLGIRHRQG